MAHQMYGDETPHSLLKETALFTKIMLEVLEDASILPSAHNAEVSSLGFHCFSPEVPEYILALYRPVTQIIKHEGFEVSNPAVLDAFKLVMKAVLTNYGFNEEPEKKYKDFNFGEYNLGYTNGATKLSSFTISVIADSQHFRRALRVEDNRLLQLCANALDGVFGVATEFNETSKKPEQADGFKSIKAPSAFRQGPKFGAN